jgi:hypothetical protein
MSRIWVSGIVLAGMLLTVIPARAEMIICPGSGERCAQVKVLFFKYWKMKEKDGPGVIIIEDEE